VGDGPLRAELEKEAASLGLGSAAIFLGDRQDMPEVLASLDVAVNTSDSESLSNVILEAMAARLPVVAYDVGGNAELLANPPVNPTANPTANRTDDRGFLIPPADENAFAHAVEKLLADPALREQLGRNGSRVAQEQFGLNRVCQRYAELYRDLLRKKRRQPAA
jgi:L-malate glycosyltransferase